MGGHFFARQFGRVLPDQSRPSEVADTTSGDQTKEQREDYGSNHSDEDGVEEAASSGIAERDHDEAPDNGTDDADQDVDDGTISCAAHDLAGEVAGDEANDDPDEERVRPFCGLDVATEIDVMNVRFQRCLL